MRGTLTIAARELGAMLRLPVGWIVIALFMLLTGTVFAYLILTPGQPASMRVFFSVAGWLLLPVVPAVSMRLLSEEYRSGTIEPLLTSPVSDAAIVLGKYAGALAFLVIMLVPTLAHVGVLAALADPSPDPGPVLAGYLSLLLVGSLYLAVGLLISSLTANQTLAFLGTLFVLLLILLLGFVPLDKLPASVRPVLSALLLKPRVDDFAKGIVDTSHIVYFVSVSALLVVVTTLTLESRRWR